MKSLIWFVCFAAAGAVQAALARLIGLQVLLLALYPAAAWLAGRLCRALDARRTAPAEPAAACPPVCFCRRCGARLPETARFCGRCGTKIEEVKP